MTVDAALIEAAFNRATSAVKFIIPEIRTNVSAVRHILGTYASAVNAKSA